MPQLSPTEIRRRDILQVGARFKGEDKDFLADLLEQERGEFDASIHDVLTKLVRRARQQQAQASV